MKYKKINYSFLLVILSLMSLILINCGKSDKEVKITETQEKVAEIKEGNKIYIVDLQESSIQWIGKKVTGQHNGYINFKSGELGVENNKLNAGKFTVDMNSITCTDLKDEESNSKLVGHLKSEDFFWVSKFPESKFEIINVNEIIESNNKNYNFNITGKLTIKDSTKTITFPAYIVIDDAKLVAEADFEIDRTEFGVKYGSGKFFQGLGDKMIKDNFNLIIKLIAKAK